jgi:LacI family transcriptional regulator
LSQIFYDLRSEKTPITLDSQNVLVYNRTVPKTFWAPKRGTKVTVTLKDIAGRVNRSVTTVSRALHDYEDVSEETKELVKRTARELGYTPNVVAQRLQKRRTDTLGLILPTSGPRLSDPQFGEVLVGVGDEVASAGFDLLISIADSNLDELEAYHQRISSRRVDGMFVVRTRRHDERVELLLHHKMPFVAYGRVLDDCDFPYVDVDHEAGLRGLIRHLSDLGHQRVGFITGSSDFTFVHYQIEGFRQAMAACTLPIDESLIVEANLTQRGGYGAAQTLLSQGDPPTAIMSSNDLMALGAISAAQDHGLDVGRDIAIAGFDDIPLADTSHPTLTTVHQPARRLGQLMGQMLVAVVRNEPLVERHVLMAPSLIIRQSTNLDLWL